MKALVLGSGGMRIGYHVGVFHGLSQRGETFDAYLGSSAGALCAAIMAQYKTSELDKALLHLNVVLKLVTSDVWRSWPLGVVSGAWKPAAVDASPMRDLIAMNVSKVRLRDSGKRLLVGAVDVITGQVRMFDEKDPDIVEGVMASAAVPAVFSPVFIGCKPYWDAATRDVAPVRAAVHMGAESITAVVLTPASRKFGSAPVNVLEAVNRATDIQATELLEGDLAMTDLVTRMAMRGLQGKRPIATRLIRPRWELQAALLEINPSASKRFFDIGIADARAAPLL